MEPVVVQSSTNFLYNYISCRIVDLQFQGVMYGLIFVFNGLFTLVIAVFAAVSRKVESPYGELKFISLALYDQFILAIVLIIIYYSGTDGTDSSSRQYILRSLGALFVLFVTLLLISVPKLYYLRKTKSELEDELGRKSGDSENMFGTGTSGMYTEASTDVTSTGFAGSTMVSATSGASGDFGASYSETQLASSFNDTQFASSMNESSVGNNRYDPDTMFAGDETHMPATLMGAGAGKPRRRQAPLYDPEFDLELTEENEDEEDFEE